MSRHAACTIVARNYTAQARVLHESFRRENPEIAFSTLVIDGTEEERSLSGIGEVVLPADLGIEQETLDRMLSVYDVMEFATALKPAMLMHLIRGGAHAALYFDPDMAVFDDLGDLFDTAEEAGVLLTPHVLEPLPRDGLSLDERSIMLAGIYNLGFIGVGATAYRFLAWWNDRLRLDAVSDPAAALFTDQRWIDWVPSVFPHRILRDPGCNVAYWNLHERSVAEAADGWTVGGGPLRFFHFSGYDPRTPWLLSKHPGDEPRVLLSERPELRTLCAGYAEALARHDAAGTRAIPYGHARTPAGLRLDLPLRRLAREVIAGRLRPADPMPLAFAEADAFVDWLLRPQFGSPAPALRPVELALWLARTDLQSAFPDVERTTTNAFRDWAASDPEASAWIARVAARRPTAAVDARGTAPVPERAAPQGAWRTVDLTEPGTPEREAADRALSALLSTGGFVRDEDATENLLVLAPAGRPLPVDLRTRIGAYPGERVLALFGSPSAIVRSPALDQRFTALRVVGERSAAAVRHGSGLPVEAAPLSPVASARAVPGTDATRTIVVDALTDLPLDRSGASVALRAAEAALRGQHGARLLVAAAPASRAATERLLYDAGYPSGVEFVTVSGGAAERRALLDHAAAVVSLHDEPSLGLLVEDAIAAGVPVVAAPTALPDPAWDRLVTLVAPSAAPEAVAAALARAVTGTADTALNAALNGGPSEGPSATAAGSIHSKEVHHD